MVNMSEFAQNKFIRITTSLVASMKTSLEVFDDLKVSDSSQVFEPKGDRT